MAVFLVILISSCPTNTLPCITAMMSRLAIASLVFLFVVSSGSLALHRTCSWKDGGDNRPNEHGYERYCAAEPVIYDHRFATYNCPDKGRPLVANWGYIYAGGLEFSTPCNNGGFAKDCSYTAWALCISQVAAGGPTGQTFIEVCYAMNEYDDCAWPTNFTEATLPYVVEVFHKK